jgi:hypothetical protein
MRPSDNKRPPRNVTPIRKLSEYRGGPVELRLAVIGKALRRDGAGQEPLGVRLLCHVPKLLLELPAAGRE